MAVYVTDAVKAEEYQPAVIDARFELVWVKVRVMAVPLYVIALYHPPKSTTYTPSELVVYLEDSLDQLSRDDPTAVIIIAGDFNKLPDDDITAIGLTNIVKVPTHQGHMLDRIYVSEPRYISTKVVSSTIPTAHMAIIARSDSCFITDYNKQSKVVAIRKRTPACNASLMARLQTEVWGDVIGQHDLQSAFDCFYARALSLLDLCYPLQTVTTTSRDPPFMTPAIKKLLRLKNRQMHAGHLEQASATARIVGEQIAKVNLRQLASENHREGSRAMWEKVTELIGKKVRPLPPAGVTASNLNAHYANTSTDTLYQQPATKLTCCPDQPCQWVSEMRVLRALDQVKNTATGLDGLPAWFIRQAAPGIATPLAWLFKQSLVQSIVPRQWKVASITPVPKVSQPLSCSDYRPISITPVLSRVLERLIIRSTIYPLIVQPEVAIALSEQYAFRPSGSTTAAIIAILNKLSDLSESHEYVHVIALDFSRAFDTVRHTTLFEKLAKLALPDHLYNWLVSYFGGRTHCTKFSGETSPPVFINASVVQGSAVGPVAFILNATDLKVCCEGNYTFKYADDCYLVVPAANSATISSELDHITKWSIHNNLRLNPAKSKEMIVRRRRAPNTPDPVPQLGIERVQSMKILGVTIKSNLSMSDHISNVTTCAAQNLYALKTLKNHGLAASSLHVVGRATLISKLTYAGPAWRGYALESELQRLQAAANKAVRWGVCSSTLPSIKDIIEHADKKLFNKILNCPAHVLHPMLPPVKPERYDLRARPHNRELPTNTFAATRNFIHRMIFNGMY